MWKTAPKQQLAYLAVNYWARLYCPDVILGVYTPDEFDTQQRAERDVTPARTRQDLNNLINKKPETAEPAEHAATERTPDELLADFTKAASDADTTAKLDKCYKYAARLLAETPDLLDKATDIYQIRTDEIKGV